MMFHATFSALKARWRALRPPVRIVFVFMAIIAMIGIVSSAVQSAGAHGPLASARSSFCLTGVPQAPMSAMIPAISLYSSEGPQEIVWSGNMLDKTLYTLLMGESGWALVLTQTATMDSFLIGFGKNSQGGVAGTGQ